MTPNGNDFVSGNLRHDSINNLMYAHDYIISIKATSTPTGGGGFTTGWFGVDLDTKSGTYGLKFTQVGLMTDAGGPFWFVYSETGADQAVTCLQGTHSLYGDFGCNGDYNQRAQIGQYQKFELVSYGGGYWIARVYDQYGNPLDVAEMWSNSLTIYDALGSFEEGYSTVGDPYLTGSYYFSHPQYMWWGTGFHEWEPSSGGNYNILDVWPWLICPTHYAGTPNVNGDNRIWFGGNGGSMCGPTTLF